MQIFLPEKNGFHSAKFEAFLQPKGLSSTERSSTGNFCQRKTPYAGEKLHTTSHLNFSHIA